MNSTINGRKLNAINRMIGGVAACAVMLVLPSCARLDIRVDMFNPELAEPSGSQREAIRVAAQQAQRVIDEYHRLDRTPRISRELRDKMQALARIRAVSEAFERFNEIDGISSSYKEAVDHLEDAVSLVNEADGLIVRAPQSFGSKPAELYRLAKKHLQIGSEALNPERERVSRALQAAEAVDSELETGGELRQHTVTSMEADQLKDAINNFQGKLQLFQAETQSLEAKTAAAIASDGDLASVIYAPEQCWARQFNSVVVRGDVGNTDIAVIASGDYRAGGDTVPSFSIKGVRLDAANVTRATFAGLKDALRIAAAASGIPLPTAAFAPAPVPGADNPGQGAQASTGSAGRDQSTLNTEISNARVRAAAAAEAVRVSRSAALALLEALAREERGLVFDGEDKKTQRQNAARSVVETFEALKGHLAPASLTTPTPSQSNTTPSGGSASSTPPPAAQGTTTGGT